MGEVGFYMFSNTVPASVEIELGVLEDRAIQRAESIADDAVARNPIISRSRPARCMCSASASRFATLTPRPINENQFITQLSKRRKPIDQGRGSRCGVNVESRCPVSRVRPSSTFNLRLSTLNPPTGVALIITLILLSVVTFMAVTFLALSRRERGAVATVTDTAGARLAADAALANAEAQIIANALVHHQPLQLRPARLDELHQSRRFCGRAAANPTNVNYHYHESEVPSSCRVIFCSSSPICITARVRRFSFPTRRIHPCRPISATIWI